MFLIGLQLVTGRSVKTCGVSQWLKADTIPAYYFIDTFMYTLASTSMY